MDSRLRGNDMITEDVAVGKSIVPLQGVKAGTIHFRPDSIGTVVAAIHRAPYQEKPNGLKPILRCLLSFFKTHAGPIIGAEWQSGQALPVEQVRLGNIAPGKTDSYRH